jgi:hypothetical protein
MNFNHVQVVMGENNHNSTQITKHQIQIQTQNTKPPQ